MLVQGGPPGKLAYGGSSPASPLSVAQRHSSRRCLWRRNPKRSAACEVMQQNSVVCLLGTLHVTTPGLTTAIDHQKSSQ